MKTVSLQLEMSGQRSGARWAEHAWTAKEVSPASASSSSPSARLARYPGREASGLRRLLGRRAFRVAKITLAALGVAAAVWLAVASAHLVRCLLVVAIHETSYLARQR